MENNSNNKIFIYLLVVFFAVFVGSGLFLLTNNHTNTVTGQPTAVSSSIPQPTAIVPTTVISQGYINFQAMLAPDKLVNPLNLTLAANSNGNNVTAFDVLINFDPLAFDFVSAKSVDQNFQVVPYIKDNALTLTVIKTGSSTLPSIFKDSDVVNLVFKPKKIGQSTFKVVPSIGKQTTKFVNDKTEVIYPSVNSILVTVN